MNYKSLPIYGKLIYITVCCFAFTQLWKLLVVLFCWSGYSWQQFFALPANISNFFARPWTLLTYMFCHADISTDPFHVIFNMLWLWWFGQYFARNHTARQFVSFYLSSGIFAGIFFLLIYNIFPYFRFQQFQTLVGASGAIFALMTAVAIINPEETLWLNLIVKVVGVKLKWFAAIILAVSFFFTNGENTGGMVCHLGGFIFGLIYGLSERRGIDFCAWTSRLFGWIADWIKNIGRPRMKATQGGKREHISADKKRDMDYNASRRQDEAQIDAILDKISRHGYEGLTAEEKQMLFDASKRRQSKK